MEKQEKNLSMPEKEVEYDLQKHSSLSNVSSSHIFVEIVHLQKK